MSTTKTLTSKMMSTSFFPERNNSFPPQSKNKVYDRKMLLQELENLFDESIIECFPKLDEEYSVFSPLKGSAKEKYGDYTSTNILSIWEALRKIEPYLLDQKSSQVMAQELIEVVKKNPKSEMIVDLNLYDAGFLTFKLSLEWMIKRIHKMINVGVDLWAPTLDKRLIVIDGPEPVMGADLHAEEIRSSYIREMLICMLNYSGVAVSTGLLGINSRDALRRYFKKEQGVIKSKKHKTPLFAGKRADLAKKFDVDLQALWSAIFEVEAKSIVYLTSVREMEYVQKCFDVATNEGWLSVKGNPSVHCCAYRTSSVERQKLAYLWNIYESPDESDSKVAYLVQLGHAAGYSREAAMECAIKYTYLKTHRLSECTFNIDEMLSEEGNTFVYLLKTQVHFSSLSKNSDGKSVDKTAFKEEHELALHLVQFTEVIEKACTSFLLHPVCNYLWELCNIYRSYCLEVELKKYKIRLLLCAATKRIMDKCFHFLHITPDSSRRSTRGASSTPKMTGFEVIPSLVSSSSRPTHLNPRFEIFSLKVCVADMSFRKGDLHGIVSVVDTYGLLCDGRLPLNRSENGHVAYFYREWYESIGICNNGYVHFENPSPSHLVPFSSFLEIYMHLFVTTPDKCFHMGRIQKPIDLSALWTNKQNQNFLRGTVNFDGDNGCIFLDYIALKDAVDITMKLCLGLPGDPLAKPRVFGCISASYGNMLDDVDYLRQGCYKAIIFNAGDVGKDGVLKVGPLSLRKSVMAVPADGTLFLEACFYDEFGCVILDEQHTLDAQTHGSSEWRLEKCSLKLTVEWSQGPKSAYC